MRGIKMEIYSRENDLPTVINVNGSEVEKNSEIPSALVIDNKQAYTRFSLR